ncbi:class I SAM-dependent methyltransferase [Variovorax sp. efr-133-TYG-130]|uniref:class I SAM-dependent methyltransferase n=1 Tax=Variovorax sp. efr-133-TYG-130 TaxID=3040327 RepID=UPI0025553107|nr:class I SAM-dependent methyltransferase [Variovorax sp. efr-133-TYG-130]
MEVIKQQHGADEQARLWNGHAGHAWVDVQATLDQMFAPLADLLVEAASQLAAGRVLDIGCGTGATTLAVARLNSAQDGQCVGIDISAPMIDAARNRAEKEGSHARFICADARTHAFEAASFDLLISRFGVMFFDDPVGAFINLRHAATDDAGLRFIAWRSAGGNPFMTTAERAAAPLLPKLPPRTPGGPGQFAFADRQRVEDILQESGWHGIDIRPIDVTCTLPEKELLRYLSQLGPVGKQLQEEDAQTRSHVIAAVRPAFEPYVHGDEVRFTAACWMVAATASIQRRL